VASPDTGVRSPEEVATVPDEATEEEPAAPPTAATHEVPPKLTLAIALVALLFSLPSAADAFFDFTRLQSPFAAAGRQSVAERFVRALYNDDAAGVRRTLAYTEAGSIAERYARVQINITRGFTGTWDKRDFDSQWGHVDVCETGGASGCVRYNDFQFNADDEIRDLSVESVPVAALMLDPRTSPEKYGSELSPTFAGGRASVSGGSMHVALLLENTAVDSTIEISPEGVFCEEADGTHKAAVLDGVTEIEVGRRGWAWVSAPCDTGGWIGIPFTTPVAAETISWIRVD
jgi:hypothetical protein